MINNQGVALPLNAADLLVSSAEKRASIKSLISARLSIKRSEISGQGAEERTFKDW